MSSRDLVASITKLHGVVAATVCRQSRLGYGHRRAMALATRRVVIIYCDRLTGRENRRESKSDERKKGVENIESMAYLD